MPTFYKAFLLQITYMYRIWIISYHMIFFSNLVEEYMHETVTMLKLFEKDCMETYVAQEAKNKENSIDERLAVLEKKWVI